MNINILSDLFSLDKNLFKIDYPIDIYIDNPNAINNSNYKVYIVTEPKVVLPGYYGWLLENYKLFNKIITYDEELLKLPNSIKCVYGTSWVKRISTIKYDNDKISFIIGNKNFAPGHSLRHSIYNNYLKINKNFETFISTRNPIQNLYNNKFLEGDDKTNLFYNHAFHLCIENCRENNYFTEKIMDCFQTMTVPIYWGAPNIGEFFDINGIIILNTDNIDEIANIINSIDLISFYKNNIESIKNNFELSLKYVDYEKRLIDIINN